MARESIKGAMVEAMQETGYDFVSACEIVQRNLDEIRRRPGRHRLLAGNKVFILEVASDEHTISRKQ